MANTNKLSIQIYGAKYNISTVEDPAYVQELAGEIDKAVQMLVMSGQGISVVEAMVLISLSYLDQYKKSEKSADHLRSQVGEYLEDAAKARAEVEELRKQLAKQAKEKA